ncbi:hypothetical protein [Szabonella alba]|uniref:Uncharacterized protein n=1 Tax=Szabonella alba TaxID=2804194 RepID=A0A8K0Y190_9RHOB|nr:hypothetical protein [Szabonella alba]MBL4915769.1 hypothetical protein [Szabonella alba]
MRRSLSTRGVLAGLLLAQIGLATVMAGSDLLPTLPRLLSPANEPAFDVPVRPGDQTRRYRPGNMPLAPSREGNPDRPFRSTGDMPERLTFLREGDVLLLTGGIAEGDSRRFEEWLMAEGGLATVRLNSPGGAVEEALSIARQIREADLDSVMEAGDICLSACPYILAGGVNRSVDPEAQVGLHQHYFGASTILPAFIAAEDIQRGQARVMELFLDLGIDPAVMRHALATPPEAIYVLLPEELERYRLIWTEPEPED